MNQLEVRKEKIKKSAVCSLKIIKGIINEYKEKMEEEPSLREKIKEYSNKHNIFNIPLMRRFANPVKDPDPLAATMIALSYQFPIIMKTSHINRMGLTDIEKDTMIERRRGLTRKPGWTGCKKELVNIYLERAEEPSDELKKKITSLYQVEDKKARDFMKIKIKNVLVGAQSEKREKVKLQTPLIKGLQGNQHEMMIAKILVPETTCSAKIQKLYDENQEILETLIPEGVAMNDQASAIRASLDSKERFMPILQTKIPSKMYQHSTALFSNHWQAVIDKESEENEEMETDISEEIGKEEIVSCCESVVETLYVSGERIHLQPIMESLKYSGKTLYEIIERARIMDPFLHYLKTLLRIPSKNGIEYSRGVLDCIVGFNDVIRGEYTVQIVHVITKNISALLHIRKDQVKMNAGWTTYKEIKEIYILSKAIQERMNSGERKWDSLTREVNKMMGNRKKKRQIENTLFGKYPTNIKEAKMEAIKMENTTIQNMEITSIDSVDVVLINEVVAAMEPIDITSFTAGKERSFTFTEVNGMPIINISHFLTKKKSNAEFDIDLSKTDFFKEKSSYPFLRKIEIKQRIFVGIKIILGSYNDHIFQIERGTAYPFWMLYQNMMSEEEYKALNHSCYVLLEYHLNKGKIESLSKEMVAFWSLFSRKQETTKIITKFNIKNGLTIDLDFRNENQNELNALWIDKEKKIRCFSWEMGENETPMENYMKVVMASSHYPGYRMEIYRSSFITEIEDIETAMHILSSSSDPEKFVVVKHLGVLFKMYKDIGMLSRKESSLSRTLKSLKRSFFIEKDGMQSFCFKRQRME